MQSVDEFTPSTTEPVFGSGLVSQTKSQPLTNNDVNDNEKVIPPSEPVVNGQNDAAVNKLTSNENITNGTTENMDVGDSSAVHVNGQEEKPTAETMDVVKSTEELTIAEEPPAPSIEPQPVLSTPVETVTESSSSVQTTTVEIEPSPVAETTNNNVPEVPVTTESETTEPKSKSPRGKVKAPVVSTTPVRQSTRARKPGPSSSTNADDNDDDDMGETIAPVESAKRTKRPAATSSVVAAEVNDQDEDITEGKTKAVSTPVTKKRAATKPAKSSDVSSESETIQTPPKKARTSANKKTPEPPAEEYVRKLRPRK